MREVKSTVSSRRRSARQVVMALLIALLTLTHGPVLAQGSDTPPEDVDSHAPELVDVIMTEYAIMPQQVVVPAGDVAMRLVNAGIRRHTLVVLIDGVEIASPNVRPGDAAVWQFSAPQPGEYLLWCGEYRHLEKGMTGTLLVTVDSERGAATITVDEAELHP